MFAVSFLFERKCHNTYRLLTYKCYFSCRRLVRWPACRLREDFGKWLFAMFCSFLFERKCHETPLFEVLFSETIVRVRVRVRVRAVLVV